MARGSWLRVTVWLGVAALAVHHLRYLLAFGERSGAGYRPESGARPASRGQLRRITA